MEKFSKWRDPGTGIQPFLPPVPAVSGAHETWAPVWGVYRAVAGVGAVTRSVGVVLLLVVWGVLVEGLRSVLAKIPALSWRITRFPAALIARLVLFLMGYWWIDTEVVQIKRVRGAGAHKVHVTPRQGDLVVCNWTGVVDVLYLAFRFNPTFLLPIHEPIDLAPSVDTATNNLPSISQSPRARLIGYHPCNLLTLLRLTGYTPSTFRKRVEKPGAAGEVNPRKVFPTLDHVRRLVPGPVVVFPEGTTSNGRALLRFAQGVLGDVQSVPVRGYTVWVLFFKHPAPSAYSPTATYSTPSSPRDSIDPLNNGFSTVLRTLLPRTLSVRWLHPHSAPSSGDFLPSETLGLSSSSGPIIKAKSQTARDEGHNVLADCCATLLLQLGRVKPLGLGWEDKDGFLAFVKDRGQQGKKRETGTGGTRAAGKLRAR